MIICCGEALIDMLPRIIGKEISSIDNKITSGEKLFYPVAGGAVFNTAIALGRLGASSGFFCGISNDQFGDLLLATLEEAHVDHRYCIKSDRTTTLAVVALNDGHATYTFYDEGSAGRMIKPEELPSLDDNVKALHFGAISLIPEPCGSTFEALMMREASSKVICFDPNIRANFIDNKQSHQARMARMVAKSDIIKVSDEDIDWMTNGANRETCIAQWLEQGASLICLTKGSDGVTAYTKDHKIDMPVKKAIVADTVGAGDSFNAGLLRALDHRSVLTKDSLKNLSKADITFALDVATHVAAITVSRAGANSPWSHELPDGLLS